MLAILPVLAQAQTVNIPDNNFRNALLQSGIDTNGDNLIQLTEAQVVDSLFLADKSIFSLTGIKEFENLIYLDCSGNYLTELDLDDLSKLVYLDCRANDLIAFDPSPLSLLFN